jgi:predicted SAM-dependent methyltransferase
MQCLNLGCGFRFHPDWTNIDFTSTGKGVIAHNLTKGISYPDASFDVVYHSHVLEHFPKQTADFFIQECRRILRPQGILRVVVPDLEQIARTYLKAMQKAIEETEVWEDNYNWILLEMYDQTVRNASGGAMIDFLVKKEISNRDFIIERCGIEGQKMIDMGKEIHENILVDKPKTIKQKLKPIYRFLRFSQYRRNALLKLLLGKEYQSLEIGRFRQGGEIHQWMYDRYSLAKLLEKHGFDKVTRRSATESYIDNWSDFNLDTEADGRIYKPDSLYMEAIEPSL